MTYSICSRPHLRVGLASAPDAGAGNAILASSLGGCYTAGRFSTVARPCRGRRGLVQLLLVPEKQISTGEAAGALGALERFFFGMRTLVAFQVLETGKGTLARRADVGSWLIGFWCGKGGRRLGVDGYGGSCKVNVLA